MAKKTGLPASRFLETVFGGPNQIAYETGLIETTEFAHRIREHLGLQLSEDEVVTAATEIFWPNWPMIPVVAALARAGFRLGILSNTCSAHWAYVTRHYRFLSQLFGPVILSYEVQAMKPAASIYSAAQSLAGVPAERIFFVDDRVENVTGARQSGFQAVLYESVSQTARDLRNLGLQFDY